MLLLHEILMLRRHLLVHLHLSLHHLLLFPRSPPGLTIGSPTDADRALALVAMVLLLLTFIHASHALPILAILVPLSVCDFGQLNLLRNC
jgi:hypothetical protein